VAEGEVERRLAAILAADVVGYSRLMEANEADTLAAMKAHRRELWTPMIEKYGGRIVGTAGDSIMVEFASAVAAVECAAAVQLGMTERNADQPEERRMLLRVGVNIGEVIVDGDDIYGDGVNVAARLEELAAPGGVCISGTVEHRPTDPRLALDNR
jgi:adenylate cyclase